MNGEAIKLGRRADGVEVEADLLDGMAPDDFVIVGNEWAAERSVIMQELLRAGVPRHLWPQSIHWDWRRKGPELRLLEATGFGVVCEQQWQGVMLTKTASYAAKLDPDQGKPLVYVDFLEAAPWNWAIPEIARRGGGSHCTRARSRDRAGREDGGGAGAGSSPPASGPEARRHGPLRESPEALSEVALLNSPILQCSPRRWQPRGRVGR